MQVLLQLLGVDGLLREATNLVGSRDGGGWAAGLC